MTSRKGTTPKPSQRWPTYEEALAGPITARLIRAAQVQGALDVMLDAAYRDYMEMHIRPCPVAEFSDRAARARRLKDYRAIRCPSLRPTFVLIWQNSPAYLRDTASVLGVDVGDLPVPKLAARDLSMSFWQAEHNRRIAAAAKNGSGPYIDEREVVAAELAAGSPTGPVIAEKQHKYEVQISRFADAATTFGLVDAHPAGAKVRYLTGTERLNEMMIRIEGAAFCAAQEAGNEG